MINSWQTFWEGGYHRSYSSAVESWCDSVRASITLNMEMLYLFQHWNLCLSITAEFSTQFLLAQKNVIYLKSHQNPAQRLQSIQHSTRANRDLYIHFTCRNWLSLRYPRGSRRWSISRTHRYRCYLRTARARPWRTNLCRNHGATLQPSPIHLFILLLTFIGRRTLESPLRNAKRCNVRALQG